MYRYYASEVVLRAMEKIGVRSAPPHALAWDHLQSLLNQCYRVIYDRLITNTKDKPYSHVVEVTDMRPCETAGLYALPVPQFAREFVLYAARSIHAPRTVLTHCTNRWEAALGTYYLLGDTIYVYPYPNHRLYLEYIKQPQTITVPATPVRLASFPFSSVDFMDGEYVYSGDAKMFLKAPYTVSACSPRTPSARYDTYTLYLTKVSGVITKIEALRDGESSRMDLSDYWIKQDYDLVDFIVDEPLIFVSYQDGEQHRYAYIADKLHDPSMDRYNLFDYTGRETTGRIIGGTHDDVSGYGVLFRHEDRGNTAYYYAGWTPDTYLNFPTQISYDYYICLLACELLFDYGGSDPSLDRRLAEARNEFMNTVNKDHTSFQKLDPAPCAPRPGVWRNYGRFSSF